MRRNLQTLVCAAGIGAVGLCLGGCHRDSNRSFGWESDRSAVSNGSNSGITGVTGSSASPYTYGKPEYHNSSITGYTGSSAAPNRTYYRDDTRYYQDTSRDTTTTTDTRPGMVDEKKKDECNPK